MNYYNQIKEKIIDVESTCRVKDYSKNKVMLDNYYEIGRILVEAGNKYGDNIVSEYARKLAVEIGKKYDKSTLFKIRKFYQIFSSEKVAPVVPQLSWSHCLVLLPLKDINEINYYIEQVSIRNLSKRQLRDAIKSNEYERLDDNTKNKLINNEKLNVADLVKNPITINNNDYQVVSEKVLQKLILENIPGFLTELGNGFSFIKNEYKIKLGDSYNYIDLLLYNFEYNCYVVVELKVTELKKEHIGQIQVYMNYIDSNLKKVSQDKTIGIIICKKDNKFVIKYCSDPRVFSTTYILK